MSNLKTITEQDFDQTIPTILEEECWVREAARAVLVDEYDQIYLMHVTKHGYHKLPGGGVDKDETIIEALKRELLEEVGCRASVEEDLGTVVEYRKATQEGMRSMKQISYCYKAKQIGEQQASALEEGEIEEGVIQIKAKDLNEAIKLLESDKPDNREGQFIQNRDLAFLRQASALLEF